MAISKRVVMTVTCTCDKCGAVQVIEGAGPLRDVPDGWGDIKIEGMPKPEVHKMADKLEGVDNDVLGSWEDDHQNIQRLLCTDCVTAVWADIGLPERPPQPNFAAIMPTVGVAHALRGPGPYGAQAPKSINEALRGLAQAGGAAPKGGKV